MDKTAKERKRADDVRDKSKVRVLKKNLNGSSRPSEHPPVRGENVKTFRWDHRLQRQNLFMACFYCRVHARGLVCFPSQKLRRRSVETPGMGTPVLYWRVL